MSMNERRTKVHTMNLIFSCAFCFVGMRDKLCLLHLGCLLETRLNEFSLSWRLFGALPSAQLRCLFNLSIGATSKPLKGQRERDLIGGHLLSPLELPRPDRWLAAH